MLPASVHASKMITQRPDHLVRNPESPFLAAEPVLKAKRACLLYTSDAADEL